MREEQRKINILHLAGSSQWAGGEVYLKDVVQKISRDKFNISVVCPEPGILIDKLKEMNQSVDIVDMTKLISIKSVFALANYIKNNRIDIVQSHGARSNFYARLAKLFHSKVKVISTVHNSLYDYDVSGMRKMVYVVADKLTACISDKVITVSKSLARDLIDKSGYPMQKIINIYNGVDVEKFNPDKISGADVRKEFNCEGIPLLGIIGRMTPQKGHKYLLNALPKIVDKFPSIKLFIAGGGPLRKELEELSVSLSIRDSVIFAGVRDDIPSVLAALDILINPSVSEGFPYTVLEAMAMQKPVVATAVNGVPEMISHKHSGILVPRQNSDALRDVIIELLSDKGFASLLGVNARKTVVSNFKVEKMILNLEQVYTELKG